MNKATYFIWSAILLGIDQAIKHAVRLMPEGEPFFRCPPFFELERVTNTGVAFSLFSSMQGIVVLLPAALMLLLCVYQAREKTLSTPARLAISGLIGGGLGNLVDRILFGGVTDYIRRPFNLTVTQRRVSNALTLYARQKHLVHLAEEQVYEHEKTNSAIINILSHVVESRNFESGTHILHVRAITDILLRQLICTSRNGAQNRKEASWLTTNFSLACSPQRRR